MAAEAWEAKVRWRLDEARAQLHPLDQGQFKNWLRKAPRPPVDRWAECAADALETDLMSVLGREAYCSDYVRGALRFYLHRLTHCEEHAGQYERTARGLAELLKLVYYTEKSAPTADGLLNTVLDTVISALAKFPRWIKVDLIAKTIFSSCPVYVAVRLFQGFDSPSEPLPRSLLQSAAFTHDHHYFQPVKEGYSIATRIQGWGPNRLANLGCLEGSAVDARSPVTLPRFGGHRVTAFSVGVSHSLFLTEHRKLFVTGRLKNWTGRPDDERIALTPVEVQLPPEAEELLSGKLVQCRRVYAGRSSSELLFSTALPLIRDTRVWRLFQVVSEPGREPFLRREADMKTPSPAADDAPHMLHGDRYNVQEIEQPCVPIPYKPLNIELWLDNRGQLRIACGENARGLPRELHICVGNVVHRHHAVRAAAFCDNGDVYAALQVDRQARNYVLVRGVIRRLHVANREWQQRPQQGGGAAAAKVADQQYYLIAEQVPGAEHITQFSVDINGDNLLFEIRDQPRARSFLPPNPSTLNVYDDLEVAYGGATRDLELLAEERACGNVFVDEEELIELHPHSEWACPRPLLTGAQLEAIKQQREAAETTDRESAYRKFLNTIERQYRVPTLDEGYFGASLQRGSLQLRLARTVRPMIDMRTQQYEDELPLRIDEAVGALLADLARLHPAGFRVTVTGRTEAFTEVTVRPIILIGTLEAERSLRGLRLLRVCYNGEHEFEIVENLWEQHTPHFGRSLFHSAAAAASQQPVIECPFPEDVMRACERALIDPASTEGLTTNQLLNMLDVADYVCAALLAHDVVYRLLRNATRADINEVLGEILQAPNSRAGVIAVLSRMPHILLDWPLEGLEPEMLYEACERAHEWIGPVQRADNDFRQAPPGHATLSLLIQASPNGDLAVGRNDLPLSETGTIPLICQNQNEDNHLELIALPDRVELLCPLAQPATSDKALIAARCRRLLEIKETEEAKVRGSSGGIAAELDAFLASVPQHRETSPALATVAQKTTTSRQRRASARHRLLSERQGAGESERGMAQLRLLSDEPAQPILPAGSSSETPAAAAKAEEASRDQPLPPLDASSSPSARGQQAARGQEEAGRRAPVSFAEILREEQEAEARSAKKPGASTPKRAEGGGGGSGRKGKFRPLSFSGDKTPAKSVAGSSKHDWTQNPRPDAAAAAAGAASPSLQQQRAAAAAATPPKSFSAIMQEQSERKSGISRRRGPSVSGCQLEAAAIDALAEYYTMIVEDHQLVSVEPCYEQEETAPRWNADGDLYLD